MVYVQNKLGQPLMPTEDYRQVRKLLKDHKAKIVKRTPFTIRLTIRVKTFVQNVTLGVDAGSKTIGLSASTEKKEVFAAEAKPRNDVVELLSARKALRRVRRARKTRYRSARYDNRVKSKHKGWIAPSIQVKINEHIQAIKLVCSILPVTTIRVETAEFDTQRLKALEKGEPLPVGKDYQLGEQYDFYNVRQYVLHRDGYECRNCGGCSTKTKPVKLHIHHIESRTTGSNRPDNLITLCEHCHRDYHSGKIVLKFKKTRSLRDAAFMGIMRKMLIEKLKKVFVNKKVCSTYGYITKFNRDKYNIEKSHINDGFVIAKNFSAVRLGESYFIKFVRRHNRKIHYSNPKKDGKRQRKHGPYIVYGFRLYDKVKFDNAEYFIFGRRESGQFKIKTLEGTVKSKNYKKLKLIEMAKSILITKKIQST